MARYRIFPASPALTHREIAADSAANVMAIVGRLDCREADVLDGNDYSFSLRLEESGTWCIFHRAEVQLLACA
ncbi:hypothetical protein ACFFF7_13605 [Novosphingobium aquiterrae]|uniref:Uncharacterized protein n=1 Tax=Novosphingobium aquiterrae TaxID=624388 RepID=A0ABV6PKS5_9SPHN